ncbi:MAG: AAA family ATPase [archaeon]
MIKTVSIKNYRSIKDLNFELGKLNAFIGSNNAGKTNIMNALNLILGESYPSDRGILETDFFNHDLNNPIEIKIIFDSVITIEKFGEVWGFCLKCSYANGLFEVDYNPVDKEEKILHYYSGGKEVRVTNEMRSKALVLLLSLRRDAETQLKATQWTIYGKILNELNKCLIHKSKEEFNKCMQDASKSLESEKYQEFIRIIDACVKDHSGLNIQSEFIPFDSLSLYKNIRLYLNEEGQTMKFSAEQMGRGIQSALSLGILMAYKEIVKDSAILIIEEPEIYLHPHACKHFYSSLKELSDKGTQVIYATHSPYFIPIENYKSIYLTQKILGETKVVHILEDLPIDTLKFISLFNDRINEIFFSNKVILVEGFADKIFLEHAMEISKIEKDKRNISVIECGGISEIKFMIKILKKLDIKTLVLCDEDTGNQISAKELKEIESLLNQNSLYIMKPNLEGEFKESKKFDKKDAILKTKNLNSIELYPPIFKELIKILKGD